MNTLIYLKKTGKNGHYRYWYWHAKLEQVIKACGKKPTPEEIKTHPCYPNHPYVEDRELQVGDIVFHMEKLQFVILMEMKDKHWIAKARKGSVFSCFKTDLAFVSSNIYGQNKIDPEVIPSKWKIKTEDERNFIEKSGAFVTEKYIVTHLVDIPINEKTLLKLHQLLLGDIFDWAGTYRTEEIVVGKFNSPTLHQSEIKQVIKDFFHSFDQKLRNIQNLNLKQMIQLITDMHIQLAWIHPFKDGNGRVIRFLAEIFAKQQGYYLIWDLWFNHPAGRKKYHYAVRKAINNNAPKTLYKIIEYCIKPVISS